jgi:tRNA-Thr(GGU) m(6)t(6)A37 methyltransferase TsaA
MCTFDVKQIGVVRSTLTDRRLAPMQGDEGAPAAVVEIDPAFAAALVGVALGEEVVILTWLHEADRDVLQVHPRDDLRRPLTGVFATRSSDRPNPIGLHRVTVLGIDRSRVEVAPLEAIDGTPVLDVKPVLRSAACSLALPR